MFLRTVATRHRHLKGMVDRQSQRPPKKKKNSFIVAKKKKLIHEKKNQAMKHVLKKVKKLIHATTKKIKSWKHALKKGEKYFNSSSLSREANHIGNNNNPGGVSPLRIRRQQRSGGLRCPHIVECFRKKWKICQSATCSLNRAKQKDSLTWNQ